MPAIYHEGSWLGNATDPEVLVKDTVGWTGKNLFKNMAITQTINGVTFTVNDDGSVTVNGTGTNQSAGVKELNQHFTLPAGNYILSGSPHNVYSETGFRLQIYNWTDSELVAYCETDEDVPFSIGENKDIAVRIWFRKTPSTGGSNITFYPMLRKADITDPTYEPYHESVQNQLNAQGVLGAKNLLENKLSSKTKSGITVTVNSNKSVTLSGTNSSSSAVGFVLSNENDALGTQYVAPFKAGESYIFSGGGTGDPYDLQLLYKNGTYKKPTPNKPFILEADVACVYFSVAGNATVNATVYPMIRLASDPDDTYQPYAMTNRELTEEKINIADLKTVVSASSDFADFKTRIASL